MTECDYYLHKEMDATEGGCPHCIKKLDRTLEWRRMVDAYIEQADCMELTRLLDKYGPAVAD